MDHMKMEDSPIDLNLCLLNESIILIIIPININKIINNFNLFGIIINCSGYIIHVIIVPKIIGNVLII